MNGTLTLPISEHEKFFQEIDTLYEQCAKIVQKEIVEYSVPEKDSKQMRTFREVVSLLASGRLSIEEIRKKGSHSSVLLGTMVTLDGTHSQCTTETLQTEGNVLSVSTGDSARRLWKELTSGKK